MERGNAVRLTLYNHKGGVGKTTLTINIASAIAEQGKRVLLVDSDPQANISSYLIREQTLDRFLDESDSARGQTIWSAMKPVVELDGVYNAKVRPIETDVPNLFIIPGDIKLSDYENSLNDSWTHCFQRKIKGYRVVGALSEFVSKCCRSLKIDYVFYDAGPNVGPLNRVILLDCDYFVVPAACDLFSRRAFKTLGYSIVHWVSEYKTIRSLAPSETYLLPGLPKYSGFIPQQFRIYGGSPSLTSSNYIAQLEKALFADVIVPLRKEDPELVRKSRSNPRLGMIKDYQRLVQMGQDQGVPIYKVTGGDANQKEQAKQEFERIASQIMALSGGESDG